MFEFNELFIILKENNINKMMENIIFALRHFDWGKFFFVAILNGIKNIQKRNGKFDARKFYFRRNIENIEKSDENDNGKKTIIFQSVSWEWFKKREKHIAIIH